MENIEYKCPNCGAKIEFDSQTQKMLCPYCDSQIDVETLIHFDEKLNEENVDKNPDFKTGDEWENAQSEVNCYVCSSCGGEVITDKTTAATNCPYCDNPIVISENLSGFLKPDYVIPFKLSKEDAKNALLRHFKKKPLLPKIFKSENHIDEIKGIYVPFWLFDATNNVDAVFRGERIHTWSDREYHYTETSYYEFIRDGSLSFERVPADGSKAMADDLMESIEPFNYAEAVDFQTAYLAGYLANKYDVSAEDNSERVSNRMKETTVEELENTIFGYTGVRSVHINSSFENENVKYALLPVYILNTTYKGEKFVFAMNGRTGKFVGNLPTSKAKTAAAFSALFAGFSAIAAAVLYFIGI